MIGAALFIISADALVAQDMRTANSTPQTAETRRSILAERAAAHAAKARAARETARRLRQAGYRRAAQAARWAGRRSGAAGEFLANPKKACAPANPDDC